MSDEKKKTIWDIAKHLGSSNEPLSWEEIKKTYEPFLVNRIFADDIVLLDSLIGDLNRYASNIPKEIHYKLMQKYVKKDKKFHKYFKAGEIDSVVKKIARFYKINEYVMNDYLQFFDEKRIKEIIKKIEKYEENEKSLEIKKKC